MHASHISLSQVADDARYSIVGVPLHTASLIHHTPSLHHQTKVGRTGRLGRGRGGGREKGRARGRRQQRVQVPPKRQTKYLVLVMLLPAGPYDAHDTRLSCHTHTHTHTLTHTHKHTYTHTHTHTWTHTHDGCMYGSTAGGGTNKRYRQTLRVSPRMPPVSVK